MILLGYKVTHGTLSPVSRVGDAYGKREVCHHRFQNGNLSVLYRPSNGKMESFMCRKSILQACDTTLSGEVTIESSPLNSDRLHTDITRCCDYFNRQGLYYIYMYQGRVQISSLANFKPNLRHPSIFSLLEKTDKCDLKILDSGILLISSTNTYNLTNIGGLLGDVSNTPANFDLQCTVSLTRIQAAYLSNIMGE